MHGRGYGGESNRTPEPNRSGLKTMRKKEKEEERDHLLVVQQYIRLPDGSVRQPDYFNAAVQDRVPYQLVVNPRLETIHS